MILRVLFSSFADDGRPRAVAVVDNYTEDDCGDVPDDYHDQREKLLALEAPWREALIDVPDDAVAALFAPKSIEVPDEAVAPGASSESAESPPRKTKRDLAELFVESVRRTGASDEVMAIAERVTADDRAS